MCRLSVVGCRLSERLSRMPSGQPTTDNRELKMNGVPCDVLRRLHERLGERRVRMNRLRDRLARGLELQRRARFCNQLRRFRTDDVYAEDLVVFGIDDVLHE